jgi:hypothetical protein
MLVRSRPFLGAIQRDTDTDTVMRRLFDHLVENKRDDDNVLVTLHLLTMK